jgi:hypothetical protein
MWTATGERLEGGRVRKMTIERDGDVLSYASVLELWQRDETFRAFFIELLATAPFAAYFWECRPVTAASAEQALEFVLVDSPALARVAPDAQAFAAHFTAGDGDASVATFWNLGRDAYLVAPCPCGPLDAYPHIAAFARTAPAEQQHALWRAVGAAVEPRLSAEPIWLSTSGLGVYWLHVRLDSRPKYYSFRPYRVYGENASPATSSR